MYKKEQIREDVFSTIAHLIDENYLHITDGYNERELKWAVAAINKAKDNLLKWADTAGKRVSPVEEHSYPAGDAILNVAGQHLN